MKPPLTRPKITPVTRDWSLKAFSSLIQLSSRRALSRRQHGFAQRVLDALQIDFDFIAHLDVGGDARHGEFLQRHAAFGLQADIDHGEVILDGDDLALDDVAFLGRLGHEALFQHGREIVAAGGGDGILGIDLARVAARAI